MRIHRLRNKAPAHGQCVMFASYGNPQVQKQGTSTQPMYHVCWLWGSTCKTPGTSTRPMYHVCWLWGSTCKKPGTSTRPMCHVCRLWGSTGSETRHQHTANVSCLPAMRIHRLRNKVPAHTNVSCLLAMRIHRLRNKAPAHGQCVMFAGYGDPQVKKQGTSTQPMCHRCRLWGSTG